MRAPPPYAAARPPPPAYHAVVAPPHAADQSNFQNFAISPELQRELDREVPEIEDGNREERARYSNFYALIRTMEKLENAYIEGIVDGALYERECTGLIRRFTTLRETLGPEMQDPAIAIPSFLSRYNVTAHAATKRFAIGVPATLAQSSDPAKPKAMFTFVAEAVQAYITAMDALRLNMVAVDQLHPLVADIVHALDKMPMMPPDFAPRVRVRRWLERLNGLKASDQLDEEQTRQFVHDLESSHSEFIHWLSTV